jgi:hypothetical protein
MENHLCECMYDVLQRPGPSGQTLPALNRLKAQICDCTAEGYRKFLITITMLIDQMDTSQRYTTSFRRNGGVRADHILLERWNKADAYDTERNCTDSYNVSPEHVRHNRGERCQRGKIDGGSPLRAAYLV